MSPEDGQRFESSGPDKKESEPNYRHQVARENIETPAVAERAAWLDGVFASGFRGEDKSVKPMNTSSAQQMLEDWQSRLPAEHRNTISELGKDFNVEQGVGKSIPHVIVDSIRQERWENLDKLQNLFVAVLNLYGSKDKRTGWNSLPEMNRRYLRVAEMSIFMVDAIKLSRRYRQGEADDEQMQHLADRLERYAESRDIPDWFRHGLIEPYVHAHKKQENVDSVKDDSAQREQSAHEVAKQTEEDPRAQRRDSLQRTTQHEAPTQRPQRVSEQPTEKRSGATRKNRPTSDRRRQAPQWPAGSNPSAPPSPAPGPKA